jgi:predicted AAA+ superfamily ATPase
MLTIVNKNRHSYAINMIKETILQHKKEKEDLLSKKYIPREKLGLAQKFLEMDLIKVISGPRRAGKSVLSTLLLKEKDFAYLNFDDEKLLKLPDLDELIKGIFEVYINPRFFLFDEIQNLENWEIFVNKLQRRGYNLVLTGSNAKLLSKELSTALTGRYIPIEIFPFNFREYLKAKNFALPKKEVALPETKGKVLNYLHEYLIQGGFPEVVVKNIEAKTYLDTLFDALLLKDVVKRYKVRFSQKLYDLALYLLSNFSSEFSFNKLKNSLDFNSVNTIQKYLQYLEEAYLALPLNRYSFKLREQIKTAKKAYVVDNGFVLAKSFQVSPNLGRQMENLVLGELLKRGHKLNAEIFYYKTRNQREVDFVVREGLKIKTLLQVFYQSQDPTVEKREIKALIEASEELNSNELVILTWDQEKEEGFGKKRIKFIPLWKWLL